MADSRLIDVHDSGTGCETGDGETRAADDQLIGLEEQEQASNPASAMEKPKGGDGSKGKCTGITWPWSKRDRLKRDPSLEKFDEEAEQGAAGEEASGTSPLRRCPDYFGVRSYLHHFYETRSTFKDPDMYEEADDTRHLLNPSSRRHHHCTAAWWKGFVFVGVLFLLVGIACVLVGYLLPQRAILVGMVGSDKEVIDREAIVYNYNLDACKLVGLILFCLGGITLAVALMIPSFLYRYCDDERPEGSFSVPLVRDEAPPLLAKDPLLKVVPSTEKLTEIQPARKHDETALFREGSALYPGVD